MYSTLGTIDDHAKYHLAEIQHQAEHRHLVALAIGPRRPLRGRIAEALMLIAERLEGRPRQTVAPAI